MTKDMALSMVTNQMDGYLKEVHNLTQVAFRMSLVSREYKKGVLDGIDNTILIAFRAGAKAMYDLLKQDDEQPNI